MPTIVIATILCAALLHACWNALAKGAADKHLSMAGVIIGHWPFAVCHYWPDVRADARFGVLAVFAWQYGVSFWLPSVFTELLPHW